MKRIDLIISGNGSIQIKGEGGDSILTYLDNEIQKDVYNNSSNFRAVRITELNNRLAYRDWNIVGRKFLSEEGGEENFLLSTENYLESYIPFKPSKVINITNSNISEEDIESVELEFNDILKNMNVTELYLYNSSGKVIDLLDKSMSIDIITPGDNTYTDSINLSSYINSLLVSLSKTTEMLLTVDVKYTIESDIYSYNTKFNIALTIDNELKIEDVVKSNKDVSIEYTNNELRVYPINENVDECIISYCNLMINYGK